jgi:DnaJ-class molecular chaperone
MVEDLFGTGESYRHPPLRTHPSRRRQIHIHVSLTPEQALHGGRVRAWLPGKIACPACRGWGYVGVFECPHCYGRGSVVDELPLDIAYPGGLADDTQREVPLGRLGLHDVSLVLHFNVVWR